MSAGDVFGLVAVVIGLVSVIRIIAGVYFRRMAFQERKLEIMAGQTAEKAAQYAAHNAQLENRVRVLERIITEGGNGADLALQIEALRDTERTEVTTQ